MERPDWSSASAADLGEAVHSAARNALENSYARISCYREVLRVYTESDSPLSAAVDTDRSLPRNLLRRVIDTAHSRLISSTPRPFFLSSGGDVETRARLEKLNAALTALFLSSDADFHASGALRLALLLGAGFVRAVASGSGEDARVIVERVYPWEIFHDPVDSYYGEPSNTYQVRWVSRRTLQGLYPGKRSEIERVGASFSASFLEDFGELWSTDQDRVLVTEAWSSGTSRSPGRHVLVVEDLVLEDSEYPYQDPPVVPFYYQQPVVGAWPQGLGHILIGQQKRMNELLDSILESVNLGAWPTLLVEKNADVDLETLTNMPMKIVRFRGTPPVVQAAPPLTAEATRLVDSIAASMFEASGVSQFAAASLKPAGLNSGRALRIYADREDGNLRETGDLRIRSYLKIGHAILRAARAVSKERRLVLRLPDHKRNTIEVVDWKEVDLDFEDEQLQLVTQPASILPTTPAARVALLDELATAGILSLDQVRELLELPDVYALNERDRAPLRLVEQQLLEILRDGTPHLPESFFPLQDALRLAVQEYARAKLNGAPEDRLDLLRDYAQGCVDLLKQAQIPEGAQVLEPATAQE